MGQLYGKETTKANQAIKKHTPDVKQTDQQHSRKLVQVERNPETQMITQMRVMPQVVDKPHSGSKVIAPQHATSESGIKHHPGVTEMYPREKMIQKISKHPKNRIDHQPTSQNHASNDASFKKKVSKNTAIQLILPKSAKKKPIVQIVSPKIVVHDTETRKYRNTFQLIHPKGATENVHKKHSVKQTIAPNDARNQPTTVDQHFTIQMHPSNIEMHQSTVEKDHHDIKIPPSDIIPSIVEQHNIVYIVPPKREIQQTAIEEHHAVETNPLSARRQEQHSGPQTIPPVGAKHSAVLEKDLEAKTIPPMGLTKGEESDNLTKGEQSVSDNHPSINRIARKVMKNQALVEQHSDVQSVHHSGATRQGVVEHHPDVNTIHPLGGHQTEGDNYPGIHTIPHTGAMRHPLIEHHPPLHQAGIEQTPGGRGSLHHADLTVHLPDESISDGNEVDAEEKEEVATQYAGSILTYSKAGYLLSKEEIELYLRRGYNPLNIPVYGIVSYWILSEKRLAKTRDSIYNIKLPEDSNPLDFLELLGYSSPEAVATVQDIQLSNRIKSAISEARVWQRCVSKTQATLMYIAANEASLAIIAGYYLLIIEAIVNNRITSADKLESFVLMLTRIESDVLTWEDVRGNAKVDSVDVPMLTVYDTQGNEVKRMYYSFLHMVENRVHALDEEPRSTADWYPIHFLIQALANKLNGAQASHLPLLADYIAYEYIYNIKQLDAVLLYLTDLQPNEVKINELDNIIEENNGYPTEILSPDETKQESMDSGGGDDVY